MIVSNQNLDIDTEPGGMRSIHVTYRVRFSPFERRLAALGMRYREQITVLEYELPGEVFFPAPPPEVLANFPIQSIPVTDGNGFLTINRSRTITVPVGDLDEDPVAALDPDEVRCRIRVIPSGFPRVNTSYTDVEEVPGT